jgi:hypothetical protein
MVRIILNVNEGGDSILALRAAQYLLDRTDKSDALLEFGDTNCPPTFYARRGKGSIIVYQQPDRNTAPTGRGGVA